MSSTTSGCNAVTLNQQQEQNIHYYKQCSDGTANTSKCKSKTCNVTVVENGRAIVKPAPEQPHSLHLQAEQPDRES